MRDGGSQSGAAKYVAVSIGKELTDVSKDRCVFIYTVKQSKRLLCVGILFPGGVCY